MSALIYHRRGSAWTVVALAWTVLLGLAEAGSRTPLEGATPLLWRDPQPIAERDLFWGSGSEARVPQAPFTFQEEVTSGTQPKIVVIDARGMIWDVKFGQEGHADVAANRLVWALGYLGEEMYFVRDGTIQGAKDLKRAAEHVGADGLDWTLHKVPLAHARWFASLAGQLSPAQVRRAFEAAGATAGEVDGFSRKFSAKIAELQAAVRPRPSAR